MMVFLSNYFFDFPKKPPPFLESPVSKRLFSRSSPSSSTILRFWILRVFIVLFFLGVRPL